MKPLLLDCSTFADVDAIAPTTRVANPLVVLHAAIIGVLLGLALCWVWLRPSLREVARCFVRRGRAQGSLLRYVWSTAYRVGEAMPWLVLGIALVGVLLGVLLGGWRWWWLGLIAAFIGASLAPAWAETVAGRFSKRS